ncbi:MAG: CoA transferase [Nitrospinae bacterium]|nr:CoA transferase [Nitrospinota bacterium]
MPLAQHLPCIRTLDLTAPDGQYLFRALVQGADVLVDTFQPDALDALGLGYPALKGRNSCASMRTRRELARRNPRATPKLTRATVPTARRNGLRGPT